MCASPAGHRSAAILQVGIQKQELDPLAAVTLAQYFQSGQCLADDSAAVAVRHDDHCPCIRQVIQRVRSAAVIEQPEIVDTGARLQRKAWTGKKQGGQSRPEERRTGLHDRFRRGAIATINQKGA